MDRFKSLEQRINQNFNFHDSLFGSIIEIGLWDVFRMSKNVIEARMGSIVVTFEWNGLSNDPYFHATKVSE